MAKTIIGIDLGPTSIGIAEINECGKLLRNPLIIRMKDNYNEKDGKNSMANRREFRSQRRRIKRKYNLKKDFISLLKDNNILLNFDIIKNHINVYECKYNIAINKTNTYSQDTLIKLLYHYLQHRGSWYCNDNEILPIQRIMVHFKNVGSFKLKAFNAEEEIISISHNDYKKEIKIFFEVTKCFSEKFQNEFLNLFDRRRNYAFGPGNSKTNSNYGTCFSNAQNNSTERIFDKLIGKCTLFPNENRSNKMTSSFELFRILESLNNRSWFKPKTGEKYDLTANDKKLIIDWIIKEKTITYKAFIKAFQFECCPFADEIKNGKCEIKLFSTNVLTHTKTFANLLNISIFTKGEDTFNFDSINLLDGWSNILNKYIDRSWIDENSKTKEGELKMEYPLGAELEKEIKDKIDKTFLQNYIVKNGKEYFSQSRLSIKACNLLLKDFLKNKYNLQSWIKDNPQIVKAKNVEQLMSEITNSNVKKVTNMLLHVLHKYFKKYKINKDDVIFNIEMARSHNSYETRKEIKTINDENKKRNKNIVEELNKNKITPMPTLITKYRLYEEQNGTCPYSLKSIDKDRLGDGSYCEIDHIFALSWSGDDSYNNKVLVLKTENQYKGNKTPAVFFNGTQMQKCNSECWKEIKKNNPNKYSRLMEEEKDINKLAEKLGFVGRNLSDTSYITSIIKEILIKKYGEKNVFTTTGKITNKIKNILHLKDTKIAPGDLDFIQKNYDKNRQIYSHHGVDAVAVAYSYFLTQKIESNIEKNKITDKEMNLMGEIKRMLAENKINSEKFQNSLNFNYYKPIYKHTNNEFYNQTLYSITKSKKNDYFLNEKINLLTTENNDLKKYFNGKEKECVKMFHSENELFLKLQKIFNKYQENDLKINSFLYYLNEENDSFKIEKDKKIPTKYDYVEIKNENSIAKIANLSLLSKTEKDTYFFPKGQKNDENWSNAGAYTSFPFKKIYFWKENNEWKNENYTVKTDKDLLKKIQSQKHIVIYKGTKIKLKDNAEYESNGIKFNSNEIYEISGYSKKFEVKSLFKDYAGEDGKSKRLFIVPNNLIEKFKIVNVSVLGKVYNSNDKFE